MVSAIALVIALFLTPSGSWLEASMVGHVLVEIPLLITVGAVFGLCLMPYLESFLRFANNRGIPGILVAMFGLAFWMLPRWLDASLSSSVVAAVKYISLIVLVGMPFAWSWPRMHPVVRGVAKIEFLSMLFRLGWLYLISPDRLCNNYLLDDQIWLGRGFLWIGIVLSITWLIPVFFGSCELEGGESRSRGGYLN